MELLEGMDLRRLLNAETRLSVSQVAQILTQVCSGVGAAHAQGIVRRDLKPENLFLSRHDGRTTLKVLDFGIAKLRNQSLGTGSGKLLGTPAYMTPEQLRGEAVVDHRADLYAMGVVAYELLTWQRAHPGQGQPEIITHILFERPVPIRKLNPNVPETLASLVDKAGATAVSARFRTAREFRVALTRFAGSDPLPLLTVSNASPT